MALAKNNFKSSHPLPFFADIKNIFSKSNFFFISAILSRSLSFNNKSILFRTKITLEWILKIFLIISIL